MQCLHPLPWFLLVLIVTGLLWQCGQKTSTKPLPTTSAELTPYVPENWDLQSDWSGNTLQVEEEP